MSHPECACRILPIEDCLYQAKWAMKEHVALLQQQGLPVPPPNPNAVVTIQNEK